MEKDWTVHNRGTLKIVGDIFQTQAAVKPIVSLWWQIPGGAGGCYSHVSPADAYRILTSSPDKRISYSWRPDPEFDFCDEYRAERRQMGITD